jgi:hypothetical protein
MLAPRSLAGARQPKPSLMPGDQVRVISGPLNGMIGLYDGQAPHERVAVLLELLRATLAKSAIEAV